MRSLTFGATALMLAFAGSAMAQSPAPGARPPASSTGAMPPSAPDAMPPGSAPKSGPAAPASGDPGAGGATSMGAATTTAAPAPLAVGQSVQDSSGATIGQIAQLKPDASGKQTATIKMGAESFAVDASALAVENGAAKINASQAEIRDMMKKASPGAAKAPTKEAQKPKR